MSDKLEALLDAARAYQEAASSAHLAKKVGDPDQRTNADHAKHAASDRFRSVVEAFLDESDPRPSWLHIPEAS